MSSRKTAVAGQFYPSTCKEIETYIKHFNAILDENNYTPETIKITPKAIIVPHAGYIYSGFTANIAFRSAAKKREQIKRVVIIGPSHRVYVRGASLALFNHYTSPCATLDIDLEFTQKLQASFDFTHFQEDAHHEHSTEVQIPFIQHYFPKAKVVEIVYGELEYAELSELIDSLLLEEETLLVISTDLSHFHTQQEANKRDSLCLDAMANLTLSSLKNGCEACGMIGLKAVISSANKHALHAQVLDYRTSADVTKDKESVVGYTSCLIG